MLAFADGVEFVHKFALGTSWGPDADKFCDKGAYFTRGHRLTLYKVVFLAHLMVIVFLGSKFRPQRS